MNIRKLAMSAAAVALTAGMAVPVSALSINGTTDVVTDIDARLENAVGVGVSAEGNLDANSTTSHQSSGSVSASGGVSAGASGNGTTGAGFGASIKAMLSNLINGSTSTNEDNGAQDSGTTSSSGDAGIGSDVRAGLETILVTRGDVDGGNVQISSTNAAAVNNAAEIRSYIAAELNEDANLESVEVAADAVEVTYKQNAELFAFIPVTVNATAIIGTDGDVRISYPWYSFLMSKDKAALEAKIEDRVSALVDAMADVSAALEANGGATAGTDGASANVDAEMAARVTARAQAMIVSEVKAAMAEALAEAEAATDVEAEANATANVTGTVDAR